ncbi:MAG: hypothetical protein Q9220_004470 [cf. Caloplaca sp. 1 TL-2023]
MSDYIRAWLAGPKGQLCGTQGLAEGFGDCYVDTYQVTPRCSTITVANCATGIAGTVKLLTNSDLTSGPISDLERRQVFFALTNIAALNAFFNSWYTASDSAAHTTSAVITDIVNVASPPPNAKPNLWKSLVVDSLLAGLVFLPGISAGKTLISSTARAISRAEAPARIILAASTSVYGHVFPNDGSAASDLIDIATLQNDLVNFLEDLQARLSPALQTSVNDVNEFLKMAETGAFSSPDPPNLPVQTKGLEQVLTTYIISVALSSATWVGALATDTTIDKLLDGSSGHLNMDYGCQKVDPLVQQCGPLWQDVPNNQAFTLVQSSSFLNNPIDKIQEYFGNTKHSPYTTPELLLVGAARCRQKPGWGTGIGVTMDSGSLNFDCLSQMKICTYNMQCTEQQEGGCEYLESDCPVESGFGFDPRRYHGMPDEEAETANSFFVPPGYLGPFRTGDNLEYKLMTKSPGT